MPKPKLLRLRGLPWRAAAFHLTEEQFAHIPVRNPVLTLIMVWPQADAKVRPIFLFDKEQGSQVYPCAKSFYL